MIQSRQAADLTGTIIELNRSTLVIYLPRVRDKVSLRVSEPGISEVCSIRLSLFNPFST